MSIFKVRLSLVSETASVDDLSAFAGSVPEYSHSKGERRSDFLAADKVFTYSLWGCSSGVDEETWFLERHLAALKPILVTIASQPKRDEITAELSVATNSRGTGYAFDLSPDQLELLARARCSLVVDSYSNGGENGPLPADYPYPAARGT